MKANYQYTSKLLLALAIFMSQLFLSCRKFVDINPPVTQIQTSQIFENDQSANSAIAGLYNRLIINNSLIINGGVTKYCGLSADELLNTNSPDPDDEFRINDIQTNNSNLSGNLWQAAYKNIYQTNAILEGLAGSTITDALRRQIKGEALLVRSLNYFYLINIFGDVPLVTATKYEENQSMARTPVAQIYQSITDDLLQAKDLLTATYPSPGRVRPNKWTAAALLSRVYLFQKDWSKAELQSTEIINTGMYSLTDDLNNTFLSNSTETIWSLSQDKSNTAEGQIFVPAFSFIKPGYVLTDTLLNSFETGDQRKVKWLNSATLNGLTVYYPYKYKKGYDFSGNPPSPTEYYVVFRLAELFLIRAEARARLGDTINSRADINAIRNRAGLLNTSANDQSALLLAIEQERKVELFSEWGHRWFDLKRTDRANAVLGSIKAPNWQNTDVLYPIPFDQIQLNPFLVQNPGY